MSALCYACLSKLLNNTHSNSNLHWHNNAACAVLAERSLQPQLKGIKNHWFTPEEIEDLPNNVEMEESLLFVIDEDGATKIVKRKHWGRFVRRMANKDASKLTKHGRAFRELEDSSCCQSDC